MLTMKKTLLSVIAVAALLSFVTTPVRAASEDKVVTISGEGKCAKCAMKEADHCQNAIEVEKNGKKTTYYLEDNEVSKSFHSKVCKGPKNVTATGTVKKENGKRIMTVTSIDLAKE